MSRVFGNIEQLGIVVNDADAAMAEWATRLGVGPFFVFRNVTLENFRYQGRSSESPVVTLAVAQSGSLQIEIIQQHNAAPSVYREFLAAGRAGVQHVSSWLASSEAYDQKYRLLLDQGLELIQEGTTVGGQVRFSYFSTKLAGAMAIELSEARSPALWPLMSMVADAAMNWDGSNPIREFSESSYVK